MALPFSPKRRLGQHFLADTNLASRIVRALEAPADAPIVEIGPGTGALTRPLLERHRDVTAIEVDERAVAHLTATLDGLELWCSDARVTDWTALAAAKGTRLHVIGNLPYNIASVLVFALLRHHAALTQAVLMVQREVAERLVAAPRSKQYGIPSVLTQLYASVELLLRVPPAVFVPRPAVESAVVRLRFKTEGVPTVDHDVLRLVVRAAFGQRRKVLRNSLHQWTRQQQIALPGRWSGRRAEELTPHGFVSLAKFLQAAAPAGDTATPSGEPATRKA